MAAVSMGFICLSIVLSFTSIMLLPKHYRLFLTKLCQSVAQKHIGVTIWQYIILFCDTYYYTLCNRESQEFSSSILMKSINFFNAFSCSFVGGCFFVVTTKCFAKRSATNSLLFFLPCSSPS